MDRIEVEQASPQLSVAEAWTFSLLLLGFWQEWLDCVGNRQRKTEEQLLLGKGKEMSKCKKQKLLESA